ncbi:MAG: FKBP-type peptidyl-prolyl cis-trans isomerase, partial [Desulfurococcales archaeon]|nr:FKBP-type peptidyl-prolyl cis-trans isomerase [Desulfurococcales archaeon]
AKLYKKYDEGREYSPELFIVGEGRYVKGIEEAVKNAEEVGKEYEVEIPPNKGYGERDPSKVKVFSRKVFLKNNVVPEVGKEVTIGNATGRIVAVGGGRVTVDFNHPLAGKTLLFKFKIVKKLEDLVEKVKHLIKRRVKKVNTDEIKVSQDEDAGSVEVELPKDMRVADGVNILKYLVAKDILKWIEGVKEVRFIDRFSKEEFQGGSSGSE